MSTKILVISDVHSNLEALTAVLEDAKRYGPYDIKLCAGDIVGYGPNPNEVIELIQPEGFISVLGNHDRVVRDIYERARLLSGDTDFNELLGGKNQSLLNEIFHSPSLSGMHKEPAFAAIYNSHILTTPSYNYLMALERQPFFDLQGRFALVHGSFSHNYENAYLLNENQVSEDMCALWDSDPRDKRLKIHPSIGVFGHSHIPSYAWCWLNSASPHDQRNFYFETDSPFSPTSPQNVFPFKTLGSVPPIASGFVGDSPWKKKIFFNPGSVGQPRDSVPDAHYGVVELDGHEVISLDFKRVPYNIPAVQAKMRHAHFPSWLIERLAQGK